MKVGFYQFAVNYGDPQCNRTTIEKTLSQADFDLIVLPELCTSGSLFLCHTHMEEMAEELSNSTTISLLQSIAQQQHGTIIAGIIEKAGCEHFNSAAIVGPEGIVGVHRKIFLAPPDKRFFQSGNAFKVHEVMGIKVGILLCYDIWFEEGLTQLTEQGVQLIVNPSNYCGEDSLDTIIKQAKKYKVHIMSANRLGMDHCNDTGIQFIGQSLLVNPNGEVLILGDAKEQLITTEIDFLTPS